MDAVLRKFYWIIALSVICVLPQLTLRANDDQDASTEKIDSYFSSKDSETTQAREALAQAARNSDLAQLEKLALAADENREIVGKALRFYAFAYFNAKLKGLEKTSDSLARFADDFRAVAAERVYAASVAPQVCRALARYDAELAKGLFYAIVDDLARSDSEERQAFAERFCFSKSLVRPYAPSDRKIDESILTLPDDLDEASRRALRIKLTLVRNGYQRVHNAPDSKLVRKMNVAIRKLVKESAENNDRIHAENAKEFKYLLKTAKKPATIKKLLENLKSQNSNLYFDHEAKFLIAYPIAVAQKGSGSDDLESVTRDFAGACVEILTNARDKDAVMRRNARAAVRMTSEEYALAETALGELANALRVSERADVAKYADAVDGLQRYRALEGETPILEGITLDGKAFSLDDYRGKPILVLLDSLENRQETQNFGRALGKCVVVEYIADSDESVEIYLSGADAGENDEDAVDDFEYASESDDPYGFHSFNVFETDDDGGDKDGGDKERIIISRARSVAEAELGGSQAFRDLAVYYGSILNATPNPSFLIGADGRVAEIDVNNAFDLEEHIGEEGEDEEGEGEEGGEIDFEWGDE